MHRQAGHSRPHRTSGCALSLRVALTTILVLVAASGFFRFWSVVLILFNNPGQVTVRTPPPGRPAGAASEVRILLAALQANLGRRIGAEKPEESASSSTDCAALLKAARSNHSDLLLEIAASLDAIAQILQAGSQFPPAEPLERQPEPRNHGKADESEEAEEEEEEKDDIRLFERYINGAFEGTGELLKYTEPKPNRHGRKNFMGGEAVNPSIGLECAKSAAAELRQYMTYNASGACPDDWPAAQRLMVRGCDPPPRRRCFSRAPDRFSKPLPFNSSLWTLPEDRNVRWTHYRCQGFACLSSSKNRGFFKCAECFDLATHEARRWKEDNATAAEFSAESVLALKKGEIWLGLDFSPGTGTFAAVMRAHGVTVASATLNLGAPFNEIIALRGLLPLYISLNQRLPFFDGTLDMVHSTLFLDGWIHLELLEYVLFDWDRVLRPGGLLWIDRFFCSDADIQQYLAVFGKLGYKRHLWLVVPKLDKLDKDGGEVFFSAVLEKPRR